MDQLSTEIVAKVGVNALTEVFKSCYNGLKSAGEWLSAKNKEHDFFQLAANKYVEKIQSRYGSIRIMGMANPVSLNKIYTRVNILDNITSQQRETLKELERAFDKDRRKFGTVRKTKSGLAVVNELDRFILLGKPGAGKTTFLRYITLLAATGALKETRVPIFVELKQLADAGMSLMDFLVEQFDICNFSEAGPFIERILTDGKCIILFDGLDEVPSIKEYKLIQEIENLTNKFDKNQFIISCRIAAYTYCFERFSDVEIADFDESQIKAFVFNWFGDDLQTANKCWKQIEASSPIKELSQTPLLLTLLCLAFDEDLNFPSNKADLYSDAIEALLKKWDSSRRIKRENIYKYLSPAKKENMLSRIAANTFEKEQYFFNERELERQISDFIINLPEVDQSTLVDDSKAVLKSIEAQHGIFVERARGIYSFSHLTLQEFLTAKYIVDNARNNTLEILVRKCLRDSKWREVFLITAGLLPQADDFLTTIAKELKSIIPTQVSLLLHLNKSMMKELCSEVRDVPFHPSFISAVLLETIWDYRTGTEWIGNAVRLSEKVYCLLQDYGVFQSSRDPYDDYSVCRNRLEEHPRIRLAIRDTPVDRIADKSFMIYMHATMVLIDCLFTGCYVSKEVRETILNGLFTEQESGEFA